MPDTLDAPLRPRPGAARRTAVRAPLRSARAGVLALVLATPWPADGAQTPNHVLAPAEIERRLTDDPFEIVGLADNRWEGDRTQRAALRFPDGTILRVKWARSAPRGSALNNEPRYELAAYRLQGLFLDRADWVVPPTVLRVMPLELYRRLDPEQRPTFEGTTSVLVLLQYWLEDVEALERPDSARLPEPEYATRLAHLNLLTHLIRHADSNWGNVLVSTVGDPRMYAVDNGVAFDGPESPRGTFWKDLHVSRLPAAAVQRLRALDRNALVGRLAVVAELEVREDGRLSLVDAGPRRPAHLPVEHTGGRIQLGLTDREIDGIWNRLHALLRRVDAGEITTY